MVSLGDERTRSVQACNSLIGGGAPRGRIRRIFSDPGVMRTKSRLFSCARRTGRDGFPCPETPFGNEILLLVSGRARRA